MLTAVMTRLGRVRVTLAYAATLAVVAAVMMHLAPRAQQRVIEYTSTNLHNLAEVTSARGIDDNVFTFLKVWQGGGIKVIDLADGGKSYTDNVFNVCLHGRNYT